MSSGGYANRLSEYNDKGICGLPESLDSERSLKNKLSKLAKLVTEAKGKVVILTGAGVSTSAGIPDFRGPNGIWTVEEKEKKQQQKQQKQKQQKKGRRAGKKTATTKGRGKGKAGNKDNDETEGEAPVEAKGRSNGETKDSDAGEANANGPQTGEKESEFYNSPMKRKRTDDDNGNERQKEANKRRDSSAERSTSPAADKPSMSFENCRPTLTHRAITKLASLGIVKYVITQNVDGLHRRSGLPRAKHAVLHGCVFTERCEKCGEEYFRDVDLGGVSFKKTGRKCTAAAKGSSPGGCCDGDLRDTILDWEDALPEDDWDRSQDECDDADLVVTLGTSLRIEPAGGLPLRAKKFVIVNLQKTPYDGDASLIIRARVDQVMASLMTSLNIESWDEERG